MKAKKRGTHLFHSFSLYISCWLTQWFCACTRAHSFSKRNGDENNFTNEQSIMNMRVCACCVLAICWQMGAHSLKNYTKQKKNRTHTYIEPLLYGSLFSCVETHHCPFLTLTTPNDAIFTNIQFQIVHAKKETETNWKEEHIKCQWILLTHKKNRILLFVTVSLNARAYTNLHKN